MSQFPVVIAVNGPPQIGKGWFSMRASKLIGLNNRIMSFATPLREEVMRILGWTGEYTAFKEHIFEDGFSGREHLIQYGQARRAIDVNYWSRQLTESPLYLNSECIIVDDLGFFEEQDWLAAHSSLLITVVISPPIYSIGSQYDGDSRKCLAPRGGFRAVDSTRALEIFNQKLADANSPTDIAGISEKTTLQFRTLVGESLVES